MLKSRSASQTMIFLGGYLISISSVSVCLCVCNVFVTMVTYPYISAKKKDIDTKLSGYVPWGLPSISMTSRMTLSSKSPVRNPQRPRSTPMNDPPFLTNF